MTRPEAVRAAAAAVMAAVALASSATAAPAAKPAAANMQGDQQSWIADPHMHAFYAAVKAAFDNGPANVDAAALQAKSYAIFRTFAVARGLDPDQMQAHLADIPKQVVQIAREDPTVLDSYDNFVAAVFGPQ
jgi:hypothetical protein